VVLTPGELAATGPGSGIQVELYLDPGCGWCWTTYCWLSEVARHRHLRPILRPYSLLLCDDAARLSPTHRAMRQASHRALRVLQAIADPTATSGFYEVLVARAMAAMAAGRAPLADLPATLADVGLSPTLAEAADDDAIDERIRASMAAAETAVGGRVGVPVVVPGVAAGRGFLGPIVAPAPTGGDALALWDALIALAAVPGIYEISRPRPQGPPLPQPAGSGLAGAQDHIPRRS
jgi:hypothetical protein